MDVIRKITALTRFIENRNFAGYDPYDALNSPVIRALTLGSKYGRIAWTQLIRRLPFNLRPLFSVPQGHNPKGLGLFLGGYVKLYKANPQPAILENIHYLLDLLAKLCSVGYSGSCWGYNFDWQSRTFFIPKHTPTIVNSSFIGHALLDTWQVTGDHRALDMAVSIKDFLLHDLYRKVEGDTFCFSYTPIDHTAVHNANLLGASLLIRLFEVTGEEHLKEAALASLAYSMKYQHDDGAWYYAENAIQRWIDSFHTGFNLEAIRRFLRLKKGLEYQSSYERGRNFYAENFFLADGTPKYYHNRKYPIDIHAPAQAVVFFSGEGEKYQDLTDSVLSWMVKNMWDASGYFYFRKGRYLTNKIPYMRWGQAWAFHALTEYAIINTNGKR